MVVILLIRYKYKDRDGGETAQRDRELRVCRQTKPDIISPTNQGNKTTFLTLTVNKAGPKSEPFSTAQPLI